MIKNEFGREKEEKTKGGIKMKKLILVMMVVGLAGMLAGTVRAASTDSADVNLLVTPVVVVQLSVSPTYYDFGAVDLKTSVGSSSALTLSNDGSVGISVDKAVWTDDDWDVTLSSTVQDGFDLWAMVNADEPTLTNYETAKSSFSKSALKTHNALTDITEAAVTMSPNDTEKLWFRLDMPKYTTNTNQKTIHVRLRGNSQ